MWPGATKTIMAVAVISAAVYAAKGQENEENKGDNKVEMERRRLNGPRMGVTMVPDIKPNKNLLNTLEKNEVGQIISQFGWHFEWLVTPEGGGPSFVTQITPMLGGVEHATVIPSGSLILGIRMPMGLEFGMGPNMLIRIKGDQHVNSSLVVAVGKSIDFGGVSIPLNLSYMTTKSDARISFVFGYAMGG